MTPQDAWLGDEQHRTDRVEGRHVSPSDEAFNEDQKAGDPTWGMRDLEAVMETARLRGLDLGERVSMPAANLAIVFQRPARPRA